jgi:hypothetical protein
VAGVGFRDGAGDAVGILGGNALFCYISNPNAVLGL